MLPKVRADHAKFWIFGQQMIARRENHFLARMIGMEIHVPLRIFLVVVVVRAVRIRRLPARRWLCDVRDQRFIFRGDGPIDRLEDWIVGHHVAAVRRFYFHSNVLPDFHGDGAVCKLPGVVA